MAALGFLLVFVFVLGFFCAIPRSSPPLCYGGPAGSLRHRIPVCLFCMPCTVGVISLCCCLVGAFIFADATGNNRDSSVWAGLWSRSLKLFRGEGGLLAYRCYLADHLRLWLKFGFILVHITLKSISVFLLLCFSLFSGERKPGLQENVFLSMYFGCRIFPLPQGTSIICIS